jgi:plasmid stability protein
MKTITLKDIPGPIHTALKQRAKIHGRSLNKEALACLEMAVAPTRVDTHTFLFEMRTHRASLPGKLNDQLIRSALEVGRA